MGSPMPGSYSVVLALGKGMPLSEVYSTRVLSRKPAASSSFMNSPRPEQHEEPVSIDDSDPARVSHLAARPHSNLLLVCIVGMCRHVDVPWSTHVATATTRPEASQPCVCVCSYSGLSMLPRQPARPIASQPVCSQPRVYIWT